MKNKIKIVLLVVTIVLIGLIVFRYNFTDRNKIYTLKKYNSSGKLIGTNEYIINNRDTILQGQFIDYNEKGIKIGEGQFVNNEPNGICSYYYDSGKIKSIYYRKNSKINLECTYYDENGLIEKYIMCDTLGRTSFIIKFDESVVKKYDGYSILPLAQYKIVNKNKYEIKTGDFLKVGDTVKYDYLVANIPHAKMIFNIENVSIDNSKVKRNITKKLPTKMIVEEVLTKKGLNRIKAITQYRFNDLVTPVYNDTVSFDIYVK